ncbi:hypothetical protein DPMN_177711 [Dreissena polymorpha]|uniref:Uncharacterized protein n=1 Tax=Dreissena polymorpha TaxID=45954 RepID=A0A9D4EBL7_DREPO|nr:hypothetical protein DPMN_177711 [Dreissena polymorpha]
MEPHLPNQLRRPIVTDEGFYRELAKNTSFWTGLATSFLERNASSTYCDRRRDHIWTPFYQLHSIHAFVKKEEDEKQFFSKIMSLPLLYLPVEQIEPVAEGRSGAATNAESMGSIPTVWVFFRSPANTNSNGSTQGSSTAD